VPINKNLVEKSDPSVGARSFKLSVCRLIAQWSTRGEYHDFDSISEDQWVRSADLPERADGKNVEASCLEYWSAAPTQWAVLTQECMAGRLRAANMARYFRSLPVISSHWSKNLLNIPNGQCLNKLFLRKTAVINIQ
jgi:hypothetical protein